MIEKVLDTLYSTDALIITAGAGASADSGVSTFRGDGGLWERKGKSGYSFVDLAQPHWFESDPDIAWGFYGKRYLEYKEAKPGIVYETLYSWAKDIPHFVFTSNVDKLFQRAGFKEENIFEIHGSISHIQSLKAGESSISELKGIEFSIDEKDRAVGYLPTCPDTGKIARPNICMFSDNTWDPRRSRSQEILYEDFLAKHYKKILILEIGAGKIIPTVRWESERLARSNGATLIRVNTVDHDIPKDISGISVSKTASSFFREVGRP